MAGGSVKCIVTGESSYFPPKSMEKKVAKFGNLNQFKMHYISIPARKLLRQGLTVDEVREKLNVTEKLPKVPLEILSRLKLLKKKRPKHKKSQEEREERQRYLNSKEFKDKMRAWEERKQNMTFREWVEENTGGPNRIWLREGSCKGTCIRPDIFLSYNHKACDGCPYHEYCLCRNKRLSHEKKHRKRRRK